MKASFNRLAEAELIAAARYLQDEAGLGREFLREYEARETRGGQLVIAAKLIRRVA